MLRLSKLTDYAVVVMIQLDRGELVQTSPGIARDIGLPETTVAKVLKSLAGSGLVHSQRGARGGYRLGRSLDCVSIAEVVEAMEGPIALTACVEGTQGNCESKAQCPMLGRWDAVNEAIQQALSAIMLADMAQRQTRRSFSQFAALPAE